MKVPYSYLPQQFADPAPILEEIAEVIKVGDFTLGPRVEKFENLFSDFIGCKHAIGVGSGTDALFLSLKALGIGAGDEVITTANTFVATAGAIETAGARIRFVDCADNCHGCFKARSCHYRKYKMYYASSLLWPAS